MDRNTMIERVQAEMPAKRWLHTAGVMETAVRLAERFGADPAKADLAAILHDVAKYWPTDRMKQLLIETGQAGDLLAHDKQLWHAHVGAIVAERDYGVTDPEVLDAIRWHTSGRVGMTKLDKVICLADYMEPGRDFPGVDKIRELAEHNLDLALLAGFDTTIAFLTEQGKTIYPMTVLARNDLVMLLNMKGDEA